MDVYDEITKGHLTEEEIRVDLKSSFTDWNIAACKTGDEEVTFDNACSEF